MRGNRRSLRVQLAAVPEETPQRADPHHGKHRYDEDAQRARASPRNERDDEHDEADVGSGRPEAEPKQEPEQDMECLDDRAARVASPRRRIDHSGGGTESATT